MANISQKKKTLHEPDQIFLYPYLDPFFSTHKPVSYKKKTHLTTTPPLFVVFWSVNSSAAHRNL